MEGSGTETVEADATGTVILLGADFPEVAQALGLVQPLPGGVGAASYLPNLPAPPNCCCPFFLPGGPKDHLERLLRDVNGTPLITHLSLPRATENYFSIIGFL